MYIYVCVRTYKRIKKIMRNSVRLNRKWVNLQDKQKVMYLLGDRRKNAIISVYVQNKLPGSFSGICIKNFSSRRFSVYFNLLFDTCFWCVCNLFTCECILLSAFNRDFIRFFLFSFSRFFIRLRSIFYTVLLLLFVWSV